MENFLLNFGANGLGTLIGGAILTGVLFWLNEVVWPKKNITGEWRVIIKINETSHAPFQGLQIEYTFHFLQKNYDVAGLGEKIKDIRPNEKPYEFIRAKRVRQEIDGYMERKFLTPTKVYLLIKELGRVRISTTSYCLTFNDKKGKALRGTFESTAGDTKGTVELTKS